MLCQRVFGPYTGKHEQFGCLENPRGDDDLPLGREGDFSAVVDDCHSCGDIILVELDFCRDSLGENPHVGFAVDEDPTRGA